MMAPTRPWASCLFADSSLLSARNTHRKSGREGPIPILIYTGWSIKSRPSSPREEPPCPETAVHTAQMDAPVVRPGRWPLQAPRGGRTGGGSTSGLRRQQWGPGPSPGPGRIRTIYRTAYRHSSGPASPRPRYACCPGWKRTSGHPMACGAAICQPPCQNGGSCVQPGRCHCPAGWQGNTCQTDVDECSAGGSSCPQCCVNTAGSYWCQCREGHNPSTDGVLCLPERGTPRVAPNPTAAGRHHASAGDGTLLLLVRAVTLQTRTVSNNALSAAWPQECDMDLSLDSSAGTLAPRGVDTAVEEEVQRLRSRVDVLEQKLQLVLAPLHSMASRALEHGLPDPSSLLTHSFQQLDRIDSLSEQISFLEEQLGSCSCKKQP
uniref:Epidermal growth factor-like protein 7 n=1 Tax=Canis lupus familiaris TaxID=9615 RepID=A0A8C0SSI8_CANLF